MRLRRFADPLSLKWEKRPAGGRAGEVRKESRTNIRGRGRQEERPRGGNRLIETGPRCVPRTYPRSAGPATSPRLLSDPHSSGIIVEPILLGAVLKNSRME